uniref:Uncharacterized protein n=1 Tax=uncultured bacterium contig00002 TaxID=1181494 RepID=A0A806JYB3_9BACT|nr:hypothetical protein [uncultured bacterium contig00002]
MILSAAFTFGISFVLEQWKSVPPAQTAGIQLGDKGLILSNSLNRNETAVILLNGTSDPLGPRVTSVPGQPLVFQEAVFAAGTSYDLPPVPFGDNTPWFLKDLSIDIRLNAELFQKKFIEGIIPFFIYVCPLIFMLCSLGYAIKFSAWPLANFFLGILAFRGILALETFFNSPEMQEIISSFLRNAIPVSFAVPLIFCIFGLLVCLYSVLVFIVRRRLDNDD